MPVSRGMGEQPYADQQRFLARLKQIPQVQLWTGRMAKTGGVWYEKGAPSTCPAERRLPRR
jgi:hypothetical protein